MNTIAERLKLVQQRIHAAELTAQRTAGSVRLVAVSKTQPAEALAEAYAAGQRDFGENYLQEALGKQETLQEAGLVWHFIGPIQSNKTKPLATHFHWVHSVDRLSIAQRLNDQRPEGLPPLRITVQVNISDEASKSGVLPKDLPALAESIAQLPRLEFRGLMAIPAPSTDPEVQRSAFRQLRLALEALEMPGATDLSMGMSEDLEAAILEGATLVRIGTAVFGRRPAL